MGTGKKISIGIRLAIMAFCYFLAVHYSADVQDASRIAVVSLSGGGVTAGKAESICEEEETAKESEKGQNRKPEEDSLSLCFWNEQEDMRFSCRETGKTVQATGLLTKGNPELIVRESGILTWLEKGCVMDAATAQELFGTREVNGQTVWCGGEAFTAYGTFESLKRTVVLRAGSGSMDGDSAGGMPDAAPAALSGEILFDHLSLRAPRGTSARAGAEQLLMRGGLAGDTADFTFPGAVCGDLLLVLPVLLAFGLLRGLWDCLKAETQEKGDKKNENKNNNKNKDDNKNENGRGNNAAKRRKKAAGMLACIGMTAVVAAVLFFALREHLQIPADMIPTRWSDFSFWPQWWTGQKANLLQILGSAQGEMQLEALWSFGRSVICSILAIGSGISFLRMGK